MKWVLWEQEAASSSLATPIEEKATINRLEMRFCRGFICYSYYKIRLECALFVPCCSQNAFSEHFDRPPKKKKRPAESDRSGRSQFQRASFYSTSIFPILVYHKMPCVSIDSIDKVKP